MNALPVEAYNSWGLLSMSNKLRADVYESAAIWIIQKVGECE